MENWQILKDIPELAEMIIPKSFPPPPEANTGKISRTEVSGQLVVNITSFSGFRKMSNR